MGFDEPDLNADDDAPAGAKPLSSSNVSCSICLDLVIFQNGRSCVKLICGHEFHLDCIGSAFNSRGAMQCPNCRNIEKGQWLYGSGGPACDDPHDEEFYDLSYSEMSFGVRWCPFMFSQLSSSFEEGEFPSSAYHDLLGHHALFAEHPSVSSTNQPCPYFSYYGPPPIHSSSQSSGPSVSDNSFSNHWSGLSGPSEVPSPYTLPALDHHYHSWEHHSSPLPAVNNRLGNSDQSSLPSINQRSVRANSDVPRPGFFVNPFLVGHSSSTRASNSITPPMIAPYPGSAARSRDHMQALQGHYQPPNSSPPGRAPSLSVGRHSSSHRNSTPLASSSDQAGGFYIFPSNAPTRNFPEVDNQMLRGFHAWERDRLASLFPPLNQIEREPTWSSIPNGASSFQQRHGSDRNQSQGRS